LTHLNEKIPNSEIKDGKYLINSSFLKKHIICGTTATVALIINKNLFVANCGDSEILLLEPNKKTFVLTDDQARLLKKTNGQLLISVLSVKKNWRRRVTVTRSTC
ncbi:MAG TPA: hypothetical protein EYQ00_12795, partial [Dehalococcoidia bacterium]|nr:hypothetical protein [Dehalococcoidia bacterium]